MPSPVGHALAAVTAGYGALLVVGWISDRTWDRRSNAGVVRPSGGSGEVGSPKADSRPSVRVGHQVRRFLPTAGVQAMALAAVGVLPDLDLLIGTHSGWTHSLGAAVLAAGVAVTVARSRRWAVGVAVFAAYASHVLLDWVSQDGSVPIGIMALWPLSGEHWHAPFNLFLATERRYWLAGFWSHNVRALLVELLWTLPPAAFLLMRRGWAVADRRAARQPGRSPGSRPPLLPQARRPTGSG